MNGVEITPAIIEDGWESVREKLSRLEGKTNWVHLDASDGVFTGHKTWNNPEDLLGASTAILLEVHLMIAHPRPELERWFQDPIRRIIVHREAVENEEEVAEVIKQVKSSGREIVLALNPETPWQSIEPFLDEIDGVVIMTIIPGWSGQEFKPETVAKITALRERRPDGIIEVDGGVNAERAGELVRAGANRLISSSFVWSFDDPAKGIEALKNAVQNA